MTEHRGKSPIAESIAILSEKAFAIRLANALLDRPSYDPDDDLAVLSRQLLRAIEVTPIVHVERPRLSQLLRTLINAGDGACIGKTPMIPLHRDTVIAIAKVLDQLDAANALLRELWEFQEPDLIPNDLADKIRAYLKET